MDILEKLFNLAGSLICHQLPSRSLYAGGLVLPVCSRDTGIYAGIFTSTIFIMCFRRFKSQKPPQNSISIIMCILMLPMILDGLLSYTGVIETNNLTRLFTGVLFGLPIPFFLVPAAHFNIRGANGKPVLKNIAELALVYAAAILLCILLWNGIMPYAFFGFILIFGLMFLLARLSYTIFARLGCIGDRMLYILTGFTTIGLLAFLFLISKFLLQPLKKILLGI